MLLKKKWQFEAKVDQSFSKEHQHQCKDQNWTWLSFKHTGSLNWHVVVDHHKNTCLAFHTCKTLMNSVFGTEQRKQEDFCCHSRSHCVSSQPKKIMTTQATIAINITNSLLIAKDICFLDHKQLNWSDWWCCGEGDISSHISSFFCDDDGNFFCDNGIHLQGWLCTESLSRLMTTFGTSFHFQSILKFVVCKFLCGWLSGHLLFIVGSAMCKQLGWLLCCVWEQQQFVARPWLLLCHGSEQQLLVMQPWLLEFTSVVWSHCPRLAFVVGVFACHRVASYLAIAVTNALHEKFRFAKDPVLRILLLLIWIDKGT